MGNFAFDGLGQVAQAELEITNAFETIPQEHRGLRFQRVFSNFNFSAKTSALEMGFAVVWAEQNSPNGPRHRPLLDSLMDCEADDPMKSRTPQSERDWQVAQLVAATLMQWLPTAIGTSFLEEAFRRGGASLTYTLPEIKDTQE